MSLWTKGGGNRSSRRTRIRVLRQIPPILTPLVFAGKYHPAIYLKEQMGLHHELCIGLVNEPIVVESDYRLKLRISDREIIEME